jgi:hypothetical protein
MLFLGILVYYVRVNRFPYAILAGVAMAGAVMVGYAKARAESLVPASNVGFWDRPERLVLMIVGALAHQLGLTLWILAIGPNITVIHRIVHTWRVAEGKLEGEPSGARAEPAVSTAAREPASRPARDARPVLTRFAGRGQ